MSRGFTKLGDLVKISKGKKANNITRELEAGLKRFIQIDDLRNDNNLKYTSDDGVVVQENDIIIAWDGANAGTIGYGLNGIIGSTLAALTLKTDQIDPEYLGRFLQTKSEYLRSKCTGATIPHISKDVLLNLSVPIVPIEEQHRIVKILDLAQSLIEKRKQAISYLDDYIKAVFLDMFGDPVSNPKGWEVNKLSKVCTKIADGTHFSPPLVESGIPYVTAKHLKSSGIDFFKNPTYISQEEHNKIFARCTPEKGDVLYIKDGATTGIAAINYYDFEFSMLSSLALLKPNKNLINNHYLCHWLNNPQVKFKLLQQMAGVAIQRFTLTKINNFTLPVPPIAEQENFAKIVEKTNSIQKSMQSQLEELENNFQAELQRAFRQD